MTDDALDLKERIRLDIARGVFPAAQPLRMEALKTRFDVGFSPIREALSQLVAEGLVLSTQNRGFSVPPLTRDDLVDISVARIAVETTAVRRAIALGDAQWEARVIGAMYLYRRQSQGMFGETDARAGYDGAHHGLHAAIVSGCGSQRLIALQARFQEQHLRYQRLPVMPKMPASVLVQEHEQLVELIIGRKADEAVKSIERHMMITVDSLDSLEYWAS